MALGRQFLLLLWKNWTLQKRKVCVTVFEILLPLFFGTILVLIRLLVKTTDYPNNTIWPTQNLTRNPYIGYWKSDILYAPNETAIDNIMAVVLSSVNDHTIPVFKKTLRGKCLKNVYVNLI
jgi:ATP-binding cassette subfamily A (ABC1) protein 3